MKMSKSKMLISLVTVVLAILVIGNVISLATEITPITSSGSGNTSSGNVTQIGATNTNSNTDNTNTNKNSNTNVNASNTNTGNLVGATNTNRNTNTNTNSNTSSYASTNSSKLPYAGTNGSSIVILAVAFGLSAIYAYKKVTDYNV